MWTNSSIWQIGRSVRGHSPAKGIESVAFCRPWESLQLKKFSASLNTATITHFHVGSTRQIPQVCLCGNSRLSVCALRSAFPEWDAKKPETKAGGFVHQGLNVFFYWDYDKEVQMMSGLERYPFRTVRSQQNAPEIYRSLHCNGFPSTNKWFAHIGSSIVTIMNTLNRLTRRVR